jgi:hypothetical protein
LNKIKNTVYLFSNVDFIFCKIPPMVFLRQGDGHMKNFGIKIAFVMIMFLSIAGCDGGSGTGTDDGGGDITYVECMSSSGQPINEGKACSPAMCTSYTDSNDVIWAGAKSVTTCNALGGCSVGTSMQCGGINDHPCVSGGDAGAPHCT